MDVTFRTAALAALCSSGKSLAQRWGPEVGRTVARRLLDLAAVDAATLDRLPGARVSMNRAGETTVAFGDEIVVRGIIDQPADGSRAARRDADQMLIISLAVHRSYQR